MRQSIYAISDGRAVKIGVASDPLKRVSTLQVAQAKPLRLLYMRPCENAPLMERRSHHLLHEHRIRGEWFAVSDEVAVAAIENAIAGVDEMPPPPQYHFRPFIELWPTRVALAGDLHTPKVTAQQWWTRDSIPPTRYPAVVTAAQARGLEAVTERALMDAFYARTGKSPAVPA